MQFVEASSRDAPAAISRYMVIWDLDAVVMFFLSLGLTTATCLSYCNGPSSVHGQQSGGIKAKLRDFLPGISLQFSPICKVSNLSLKFRLQSQAFLRATLRSVEASK